MSHTGRPFPYTRSRNSDQLMALREEGPAPTDELPNDGRFTPQQRRFASSIAAPWSDGTSVWYLWGDERDAIRRFIELNEDDVRNALTQTNSTLSSRLDDALWRMLCEEWMWSGKMTDKEIEKYRREERIEDNDDEVAEASVSQ